VEHAHYSKVPNQLSEAKVLASLNHPDIAQIDGIEDGAFEMELVVDESVKGPVPLDTVLNYAKQIANTLEASHDKGIVHRDLRSELVVRG
jgi:serine/threonine protein kinase